MSGYEKKRTEYSWRRNLTGHLAILVISCDNYHDVWKPFFDLLTKFWPDCPYPVYLGTNEKDFSYPGVRVVKAGKDSSWAENVRKHLDQIEEEYVLTFLEDFYIARTVDTSLVENALALTIRDKIDTFSMILPKKGLPYNGERNVFHIDPKMEYCLNTSIAIRKKKVFFDLLKPGYSAWDFEVKNSAEVNRTGTFPGIFVTSGEDYFHCLNGIWRRKWVPGSVRFCERLGIAVDTSHRPFMSWNDTVWEYFKRNGRQLLPVSLRKMLKRLLIKIGFSRKFVSQN